MREFGTVFSDKDVADINNLLRQLSDKAPEVTSSDIEDVIRAGNFILVIRDGEHIIGMATLAVKRTLMGRDGYIDDVVVDAPYREKGYGKRLVLGLIAKAREFNLRRIDLTSSPKRVRANALYQKLGFEKRDTNVYRLVL